MAPSTNSTSLPPPLPPHQPGRGRGKMLLVLFICIVPVIASYITYYFIRPSARSNYGDLIDPQRPMPVLTLHTLDGRTFDAQSLKGKWLMLMVDGGACPKTCEDKLYHIRQVRLTSGKERERIERVWLINDDQPLSTMLIREYDGMHMLRADAAQLAQWLPVQVDAQAGETRIEDHIYMVDPLGNLMMRFPKNADPNKTKKDLKKLLAASSVG